MKQVQYNLLHRLLIGLSMNDAAWITMLFRKNHQPPPPPIEHEAMMGSNRVGKFK